MLRLSQVKFSLNHSDDDIKKYLLKILRIDSKDLIDYKIIRRSIDARNIKDIRVVYSFDVSVKQESVLIKRFKRSNLISRSSKVKYDYLVQAPNNFPHNEEQRPVIIGAGPCGYFAALVLAQMGFKPLLLEQGQSVKERSIQTYGFWYGRSNLNPISNVQFGEGGAGTFSDGKLYSQVSDPDNYRMKVLNELVKSGANKDILVNNRPHIGTYKLASVVRGFRSRIESLGGEIRFNVKMEELILIKCLNKSLNKKDFKLIGLRLSDGTIIRTNNLILAPGHSARETFRMLEKSGVFLEQKMFSVGFRIEHSQIKVDKDRWGSMYGHPQLGHAEYRLAYHASNGRNVYSFCMCPGGQVVGATSKKGCVVTNGMSQHSRNQKNANSALVVTLEKNDLLDYERWEGDPLAGIFFQETLEKCAFEMGGRNYFAPVQKLGDFINKEVSVNLGSVKPSYLPGIKFADLNLALPRPFIDAIRESLPVFSEKFSFFKDDDAILTGLETRTSSPLRISRDMNFQSLNVDGLFPAGEGAGYAGGIMSAGIDGIKVAEALALKLINEISQ